MAYGTANINVKAKKADLLHHLYQNKENHEIEYHKAVDAYFQRLRDELSKRLEYANKNKRPKGGFSLNLREPVLKTKEYEKYIAMLEMGRPVGMEDREAVDRRTRDIRSYF